MDHGTVFVARCRIGRGGAVFCRGHDPPLQKTPYTAPLIAPSCPNIMVDLTYGIDIIPNRSLPFAAGGGWRGQVQLFNYPIWQ